MIKSKQRKKNHRWSKKKRNKKWMKKVKKPLK